MLSGEIARNLWTKSFEIPLNLNKRIPSKININQAATKKINLRPN